MAAAFCQPTAIRVRMGDLLAILTASPAELRRLEREHDSDSIRAELTEICRLLERGPATRKDVESKLNISRDSSLKRLQALMVLGIVERSFDNCYSLCKVELNIGQGARHIG